MVLFLELATGLQAARRCDCLGGIPEVVVDEEEEVGA
jgi:hypothetical protein